jgi:hypothetical protein
MFETIKGGIQMVKLFNQVRDWWDGKKAYTVLLGALIPPGQALVHDFQAHMSIFNIMATQEFNAFMLALGAIFIRMGVAKAERKSEQAAGIAVEEAAEAQK